MNNSAEGHFLMHHSQHASLAVLALLLLWLAILRLRRRNREGRATQTERRLEDALRRFKVEFDAFKFAPQSAVKLLLNHDHVISQNIEKLVAKGEGTRSGLRLVAHRYIEEIVPFFKPLVYYRFGYFIAHTLLNFLYKVEYSEDELEEVKRACRDKEACVIYILNHRSNVDFVLAPYVLRDNVALSFAVGEWARVWPLEYLFKSFGSYFLRRGCRDELYHTVLRRYVQVVTKNQVTQAMFPEGGLSRDGLLRPPKIGLLDAMLCSKEDRSFTRDLLFVPVGINYDRVLEDRVLVGEHEAGPGRTKLGMLQRTLSIMFGNLWKFSRRKIRKNGHATVRFGAPISFDRWHDELGLDIFSLNKRDRRTQVAAFCELVMQRVGDLIPVTPICLVCDVLSREPSIGIAELESQVALGIQEFRKFGAVVVGEQKGAPWMVDGALLRLSLRHVIDLKGDQVVVNPRDQEIVTYYANAIAHYRLDTIATVENPNYAQ